MIISQFWNGSAGFINGFGQVHRVFIVILHIPCIALFDGANEPYGSPT